MIIWPDFFCAMDPIEIPMIFLFPEKALDLDETN